MNKIALLILFILCMNCPVVAMEKHKTRYKISLHLQEKGRQFFSISTNDTSFIGFTSIKDQESEITKCSIMFLNEILYFNAPSEGYSGKKSLSDYDDKIKKIIMEEYNAIVRAFLQRVHGIRMTTIDISENELEKRRLYSDFVDLVNALLIKNGITLYHPFKDKPLPVQPSQQIKSDTPMYIIDTVFSPTRLGFQIKSNKAIGSLLTNGNQKDFVACNITFETLDFITWEAKFQIEKTRFEQDMPDDMLEDLQKLKHQFEVAHIEIQANDQDKIVGYNNLMQFVRTIFNEYRQKLEIYEAFQDKPVTMLEVPAIKDKNKVYEKLNFYKKRAVQYGTKTTGSAYWTKLLKSSLLGSFLFGVNTAYFTPKSSAKLMFASGAIGGTLGLLASIRSEYIASDPAWIEGLDKLEPGINISNKTVRIQGKDYILAKNFDDIKSVNYQTNKDHKHFSIDLFLEFTQILHLSSYVRLGANIAFIALRPSPRIYDTAGITKLFFGGNVLARIVICMKDIKPIKEGIEYSGTPTNIKTEQAQEFVKAVNEIIIDMSNNKDLNPHAYYPDNTQKITSVIYARWNSIDYAKQNAHSFARYGTWIKSAKNNLVYPITQETELTLKPIP